MLRPRICWSPCRARASGLHPPRRADTGTRGPELQERLSELGSTLPIIFLTGYPDIPATVRAIKAGAEDFLTKPVSSDDLFGVERAFAHHEDDAIERTSWTIHARIAAIDAARAASFRTLIRGNTNKQVASALGCTERTIKAHRHRVMEKMQVRSLPELVSLPSGPAFLIRLQDRHPRYRQPAGAAVRRSQSAAALDASVLLFTTDTSHS